MTPLKVSRKTVFCMIIYTIAFMTINCIILILVLSTCCILTVITITIIVRHPEAIVLIRMPTVTVVLVLVVVVVGTNRTTKISTIVPGKLLACQVISVINSGFSYPVGGVCGSKSGTCWSWQNLQGSC